MDAFGAKFRSIMKKTADAVFGHGVFSESHKVIDDDVISSIYDSLLSIDMDCKTVDKIVSNISDIFLGQHASIDDIKMEISRNIGNLLAPFARPIDIDYSLKTQVVMVCGVNGVGKTTTVGKMAYMLNKFKWKCVIGACDTFRDFAVEQLMSFAEQSNVDVVAPFSQTEDPASVAYRAYQVAVAKDADILLIDTAGRMQTNMDLMNELSKIERVLSKLDPNGAHSVVLVVDACSGRIARDQLSMFMRFANVNGMVVTKLDASGGAGIVVSLVNEFMIPIHGIGIGDGLEDLQDFYPMEFAQNIVGVAMDNKPIGVHV